MPAAPASPLFDASDLSALLGSEVSDAAATLVEAVVWGQLAPALGLTERPTELDAQQFAWAIQLGAIQHENPAGLSSRQVGSVSEQFSSEARDAILAEARASAGVQASNAPRGRFPRARAYPDAVESC